GEDDKLDESISVTIIATGFNVEQQNEIVNTETRKIIHTLEDEQKAEQELFPKESGTSKALPSRKPISSEPAREKKIVHSLEEDEPEKKTNTSKENGGTEMKFIPTSELIRNMDVVYDEIAYDEDDFVIIETNNSIRDIEVNSHEEVQKVNEEQTLFSFDFP